MSADNAFLHPGTGDFTISVVSVSIAAVGVCVYGAFWFHARRSARADHAAWIAAAPARRVAQEALLVAEEVRRAAQFAAHMEIYLERAVRDIRAVQVAFVAPTDDRISGGRADHTGPACPAKATRMYPVLAYPV